MSQNNPRLTYLVPCETANLLHQDVNMSKCQNMGLILARYVPQEVIHNDSIGGDKWRDKWLKTITSRFQSNQRSDWRTLMEANVSRWDMMTHPDVNQADIIRFEGQLEANMMVGLGGESVLENSLTFGHIDGLPKIPGSALKGLTRTYALFEIAAQLQVPILVGDALQEFLLRKKEQSSLMTPLDYLETLLENPLLTEKDEQDWQKCLQELNQYLNRLDKSELTGEAIFDNADAHLFRVAFGNQGGAGACIFYDAVLSGLPDGQLFVVDVMTPHYPDYYSSEGATPPSDDQLPKPIQFLAVAHGTRFGFAFRINHTRVNADSADTLRDRVTHWFQRGLRELGAGAKTHAGYGLFRILK